MKLIDVKRHIHEQYGFELKFLMMGDYCITKDIIDYAFFYVGEYKFKLQYNRPEHRYVLYAGVENFGFVPLVSRC